MPTWTGRHKGKAPYRVAETTDLLTPPSLLVALGALRARAGEYALGPVPFDLDPCASARQPWATARTMWTEYEDGTARQWAGDVWLNPPYGRELYSWLARLAAHGDGAALLYARTDTQGFREWVWGKADALYFFTGRLFFHQPVSGEQCPANCAGPMCLAMYGAKAVDRAKRLAAGGYPGQLVPVKNRL
jgi:hypothetical protein